jgi:hypothetical protein
MKKLIGELFNQMLLESVSRGYFKDRAGIPDYDAVLFGKRDGLPMKYSDWVGEIRLMSKEDYFRECASLQGTSYSDQFRYIVPNKVEKIEANMSRGVRYDMPYLNYVERGQEGRHRVLAASNLGMGKIPVLILYKEGGEEESSGNKLSNMLGVWDDLVERDGRYYVRVSGKGSFESKSKILRCIVSDYDYYLLHDLLSILDFPSLYHNVIGFIFDKIKNNSSIGNGNIEVRNIRYDGDMEVGEDVLGWCVVLRCMRNNGAVIFDNIRIDGNDYYFRLPDNILENFGEWDSCIDMLLGVGSGYYLDEYNLLSVDESNKLYEVTDADVVIILDLFKRANKKY